MRYNQNVNVVSAPVVERGELALVTARSCNLFSLHLEASQSQSAQFNDVVGAKSEESLLSFQVSSARNRSKKLQQRRYSSSTKVLTSHSPKPHNNKNNDERRQQR